LLWRLQHHLYGRIKNPLHILKLQNKSHQWQWQNTVPMENKKKKKRMCIPAVFSNYIQCRKELQ
jgi:hypothetical protein